MLLISFCRIVALWDTIFQHCSWFGSLPAGFTSPSAHSLSVISFKLSVGALASTAFLLSFWFVGLIMLLFFPLRQPCLLLPYLFLSLLLSRPLVGVSLFFSFFLTSVSENGRLTFQPFLHAFRLFCWNFYFSSSVGPVLVVNFPYPKDNFSNSLK